SPDAPSRSRLCFEVPDLRKFSTSQLIGLLGDKNDWLVRHARRVLADRRDPKAVPPLRSLVLGTPNDHLALEGLWAVYVSGGFDETFAAKALEHRSTAVRKWAVRLIGDARRASPDLGNRLTEMPKSDPDVRVRCQLASSAQRLPPELALPIIKALLIRDI